MKKIMFNETYGLQRAAIDGTKPLTRRAVPDKWQTQLTEIFEACNYDYSIFWQHPTVQLITNEKAPYKVGEVVAIAQSYKEVYNSIKNPCDLFSDRLFDSLLKEHKGWNNKMFVKADFMPHHIQFTDLKVERLQDISDEDCMKEGIFDTKSDRIYHYRFPNSQRNYMNPREAFAALIDKVSGRGTWHLNPWVFAYTFDVLQVK